MGMDTSEQTIMVPGEHRATGDGDAITVMIAP
jgi:hypothetical protein